MNSRKKITDPLVETSSSDQSELPSMLRKMRGEPLSSDQKTPPAT